MGNERNTLEFMGHPHNFGSKPDPVRKINRNTKVDFCWRGLVFYLQLAGVLELWQVSWHLPAWIAVVIGCYV